MKPKMFIYQHIFASQTSNNINTAINSQNTNITNNYAYHWNKEATALFGTITPDVQIL